MEGASVSCSAGEASALSDLRAGYFLACVVFSCSAGIRCESELDELNCGSGFRARDLAPSLSRRVTELGAFWASSGLRFSFCFRAAASAASLDLGAPSGLEVPPSSPPRGKSGSIRISPQRSFGILSQGESLKNSATESFAVHGFWLDCGSILWVSKAGFLRNCAGMPATDPRCSLSHAGAKEE